MSSDKLVPALKIVSIDIDKTKITEANVAKMRAAFPNLDDQTLARFLLARNNNFDKAAELLRLAQQTAVELNFPILKSSCLNEMAIGKMYVHGTDKQGRPLFIYRSALVNPKTRDLEETLRLVLFWTQYAISRLPDDKTKFTILLDRTGSKSENTDMELVKRASATFQNCFPERIQTCVIYPIDFLFYSIWSVAKWFLDPVTRAKVTPVMTLAGVEEHIDPEHIPIFMGGKDEYEYNADEFEDAAALTDPLSGVVAGMQKCALGSGGNEGTSGEAEAAVPPTVFASANEAAATAAQTSSES